MPFSCSNADAQEPPINDYELKIEVDYFPGKLTDDIIDAFQFCENYFEDRDISVEIMYDSPNNEILNRSSYLDWEDWREIEREYHDYPTSHVYFLVAQRMPGQWIGGSACAYYGAGISLETVYNDPGNIRFIIMHEIGHCIGIGLHDDTDGEVYSSSGFMRRANIGYPGVNNSFVTEYDEDDWNDAFAMDGAFGNTPWLSARIWNSFSIIGEIYDNRTDIHGRVFDENGIGINGTITLSPVDNIGNEYGSVLFNGHFDFRVPPNNYTMIASPYYEDYSVEVGKINVSERENLELGNLTMTRNSQFNPPQSNPPQSNPLFYLVSFVIVSSILLFGVFVKIRKSKSS